jgi:hypothetical protein
MEGIQITGAIESSDLGLGPAILHIQTKGVKFDGNVIISGELANREHHEDAEV